MYFFPGCLNGPLPVGPLSCNQTRWWQTVWRNEDEWKVLSQPYVNAKQEMLLSGRVYTELDILDNIWKIKLNIILKFRATWKRNKQREVWCTRPWLELWWHGLQVSFIVMMHAHNNCLTHTFPFYSQQRAVADNRDIIEQHAGSNVKT